MGRVRALAVLWAFTIVAAGVTGVVSTAPAGAAGCTVTLINDTTYVGTDAPETVCIDGTGDYTVDTAGGNDIVKVTDLAASVTATLGEGNDTYTGTLATVSTVDAGPGDDKVTTGAGDDTVTGGDGNDKITTSGGDDTVDAGTGNDRLVTSDGADTVDAGAGDDKVSTQNGDDTVIAGDGVDNVSTGDGSDAIDAGTGNDKVNGGNGDDTLDGSIGDDKVIGGSGADAIITGDGADIATGNAGTDGLSIGAGGDKVSAGTGSTLCADDTVIAVTCLHGSAVSDIHWSMETVDVAPVITVVAHVLDFSGTGATKIALAESSACPGDACAGRVYLEAPASLTRGTAIDGDYSASFALTAPPASGRLGIRVYTRPWSVDIQGGHICYPQSYALNCYDWPEIDLSGQQHPCFATDPMGGQCGNLDSWSVIATGLPTSWPIVFPDHPDVGPPDLTALTVAPSDHACPGWYVIQQGYSGNPDSYEWWDGAAWTNAFKLGSYTIGPIPWWTGSSDVAPPAPSADSHLCLRVRAGATLHGGSRIWDLSLVFVPPATSSDRGAYVSVAADLSASIDESWLAPPGAVADQTFYVRVPTLRVKGKWAVRVVFASPYPGTLGLTSEGARTGGGYSIVTPAETGGFAFDGYLTVN